MCKLFRNPNQISTKIAPKLNSAVYDLTERPSLKNDTHLNELNNSRSRSKFSSNSKLLSSSLFKICQKGHSSFTKGENERKNFQIILLKEMGMNLTKGQGESRLKMGALLKDYAMCCSDILRELREAN